MKRLIPILFVLASLASFGQSADGLFQTVTASGTNSYTITSPVPPSYDSKEKWIVTFTNASTGTVTLARNGMAAKAVRDSEGNQLGSGDILAGQRLLLSYNGTYYQVIGGTGSGSIEDGDKGDITVSNDGATWEIDAGAVTKSDVGLSNVDNTSDANKPVSTATQTALDAKQATLVSGTNIKTINSTSLMGSGNLVVGGATEATLTEALAGTSTDTRMSPRRNRNVTGRVYNVEAYGAIGDQQTALDASISSSSTTLTTTAGVFTSADVSKSVRIYGAGVAGADLITTITAFTSSTQITVQTAASTTVSSKKIKWGTSNNIPVQNAMAAAAAAGGGTVYFPNGIYALPGPLITSVDGINPNCQLYLPLSQVIADVTVNSPVISVKLLGESTMPIYGGILVDTGSGNKGVILESWIIGTGTEPSVLGSSFYNTGFGNLNGSTLATENIVIRVKSITGVTHVASTMSGFNFGYSSGMDAYSCKYENESDRDFTNGVAPATTIFGFKSPIIQNSGNIYARRCATQNTGVGFLINEHFVGDDLWINASLRGIESGTTNHAWYIGRVQCNGCATGVYLSGQAHGTIAQYTAERKTTGGKWFNFSKDVDGSASNLATVNILSSYIVDSSLGANPSPQFGANVLGTASFVNMPGINTSKRFFGNGGFRAGSANQASFPSYHEYNSGVAGQAFTFSYSTNQSTTSDGAIASFQFANTNTASGEQRIAQFNALTGGAVNTGRFNLSIANAGTLVEVMRWNATTNAYLNNTYIGSATTTPTARLHLAAGTTVASSAPLKFTTGTSMTAAEAGAFEFTTDDLFFTITTGTARKRLLMADPVGGLTSGRTSLYATTNGRITDVAVGIDASAGDAATVNALAGRFRKDNSGTTFVLTNSFITANSIITYSIGTVGITTGYDLAIVPGAGSATITFQTAGVAAAPSASCDVNFHVLN